MKKILFTCDVAQFPYGAFRWVADLHQTTSITLEGYFFRPYDYSNMFLKASEKGPDKGEEQLAICKAEFIGMCRAHDIPYSITTEIGTPDKYELLQRTRFNDLMVFSDRFFDAAQEVSPHAVVVEILRSAECPVVVIPESYEAVERILFAYDGKEDCMFALKQFSYLLPQYRSLPIEIVYLDDQDGFIPANEMLESYARAHFGRARVLRKPMAEVGSAEGWVGEQDRVLLLTGSYSRSPLSYLFRKSFSGEVIHDGRTPVFIAHHK